MGVLAKLFGDTPRVKLLEALVRLGGLDFTRPELADEAGLFKATTNRVAKDLVRAGLIEPSEAGRPALYRVNRMLPTIRLLIYLVSALRQIERTEGAAVGVVEEFRVGAVAVAESSYDWDARVQTSRPASPAETAVDGTASIQQIELDGASS